MPLKLLLQLSWRNLWRQRRRNGMMILAIIVAVGSLIFTNALIRGYQYDMLEDSVLNLSGHLKLLAPGYNEDPSIMSHLVIPQAFRLAIPDEEIYHWTTRIVVPAVVISERETRGIQLVGIDPKDELKMSFLAEVKILGRMLADERDQGVVVGKQLVEQLDTRLGRRIVLMTQGADGLNREAGFRIVGLFDAPGTSLEKRYIFTGRGTLQSLLDTDAVTELSVRLKAGVALGKVKQSLRLLFADLDILDWKELQPMAGAMFEFSDAIVLIWFVIMASALAFGLVNTLITGVMERVRELGMFRALGMRRGAVLLQVLAESLLIVVMGLLCGLVFGYLLVYVMQEGIDLSQFAQGLEAAGMRSIIVPRLMTQDLILVSVLTIILGFLASLFPAVKAVRINPLDALQK